MSGYIAGVITGVLLVSIPCAVTVGFMVWRAPELEWEDDGTDYA